MKYKKYPNYKDSGVEWLGDIPEHWNIKRLKFIANIQTGTTPSTANESNFDDNNGIPWVKPDELDNFTPLLKSKKYLTEEGLNSARVIKKDSVLVCGIGTIGKFGVAGTDLTTNQQINSVTFNKLLIPSFGKFIISSSEKEMNRFSNGNVVKILNTESQKNIFYPYPPIQEQQQIAKFLDNATQKMDTLIQKQENLIKLLKEKRQAVISHAVTRGLNPDVKFKDSGVEWLGDVPEHWSTPELIYITKNIGDGLHSTPEYSDNTGYYFINGNNINEGKISINKKTKEVSEKEFHNHYIHLNGSSVFLSINGTIGNVALYNNENVILGKSAAFMNCTNKIIPSYLMHYLLSSQSKNYFDLEVTGTTIYNLSLNSIRKMKICVPPLDEQEEIIKYCFETKNKLDTLIKKSKKSIKLLKEKRTALISSAVIGKIDVRELVS